NDNTKNGGTVMGFGFGLMLDFKLSELIHFSTGIGGEFDGGYVKYRNDKDFNVNMVVDKEFVPVKAKDGLKSNEYELVNGSTQYIMNDRRYKSTFVTIPLLLKMMTQEYSGIRYVFLFGGELGIRGGLKGNDTYSSGIKTTITGTTTTSTFLKEGDLEKKNIDLAKEGSLFPMRAGMNLGFGIDYRIAGSTSLFISANYFQSFTNLVRKDSDYLTKGADNTYDSNGWNFAHLNQGHFARAIRLNIGIMF
ncbi:MAG: hypothetical protein JNM96_00120, partial [Bacteroidia bacterium]|nr:hypothetical protein [Bacteroidia bacterium]